MKFTSIISIDPPRTPPWPTNEVQPLSQGNLELFDAINGLPSRPVSGSASAMSDDTNSSSSPLGIVNTRESMRIHRMLVGGDEGFLDTAFEDMVTSIVMSNRASAMKPSSMKHISKAQADTALSIENKVARKVFEAILRKERTPRFNGKEVQGLESDSELPQTRLWTEDNLAEEMNRPFLTGCLPLVDFEKESAVRYAYGDRGPLSNPTPDVVYGVSEHAFNAGQLTVNLGNRDITRISPEIYHPFFVCEWKATTGSIEHAVNQAAKDGAAMVHARMKLNALAGITHDREGPDLNSFVFSCCAIPSLANIYINWCERKSDGKLYYRMNRIEGYRMESRKDIETFRCHLNNILDWGLLTRMNEIRKVLDQIWAGVQAGTILPQTSPRKNRRGGSGTSGSTRTTRSSVK
ncbi:hypothetical protein MMC24_007201 [Lignoscripta atroalba]|nr:hypothetical protein [Lignoscripta atroalba]